MKVDVADAIVRDRAVPSLRDHVAEDHLVARFHRGPERCDVDAVAAHEPQRGEDADERRDELARVAVRVDHQRVRILGEQRRHHRQVIGRLQEPAPRLGPVLECLEHPPVQPVPAPDRVAVSQLPLHEARRVVLHGPVGGREVVRDQVMALAGQVARELVHGHELGMDVGPELLLALRELAPPFGRHPGQRICSIRRRDCAASNRSITTNVAPSRCAPIE